MSDRTKRISSYGFLDVYQDLGIDIKKLWCCMMDVSLPNATVEHIKSVVGNNLYYSDNKPWIKGFVLENNAHITLLYGLLDMVKPEHVSKVLEGWKVVAPEIEEFNYFDSPDNEEHYCLMAKIKMSNEFTEAHKRLNLLPHINTFLDYSAHLTVAYIKKDEILRNAILLILNRGLKDKNEDFNLTYTRITYDNMSGNPITINN